MRSDGCAGEMSGDTANYQHLLNAELREKWASRVDSIAKKPWAQGYTTRVVFYTAVAVDRWRIERKLRALTHQVDHDEQVVIVKSVNVTVRDEDPATIKQEQAMSRIISQLPKELCEFDDIEQAILDGLRDPERESGPWIRRNQLAALQLRMSSILAFFLLGLPRKPTSRRRRE